MRFFGTGAAAAGICFVWVLTAQGADNRTATVDGILSAYVNALGGQTALDKITTRQLTVSSHLFKSAKMYWETPDHVLLEAHRERQGFDGSSGWYETKRKRIQRLPKSRQDELQTDANPIRFVHLKDMYGELNVETPKPGEADGMDVIAAPNHLGATRFFFDRQTHLLAKIEEFGVNSAYFKQTTEFSDYQEIDGIKFPRRITRDSEEPGSNSGDVHLSNIKQNEPLNSSIFRKPDIGKVISGGKH
jgi:hypothetical protein